MTYSEFKKQLESQGWSTCSRFIGTGRETACTMTHGSYCYVLTISDNDGNVTAEAMITLQGFMNLVSTGEFGSPWSNRAFFNQIRKLEMIKNLVGDSLL